MVGPLSRVKICSPKKKLKRAAITQRHDRACALLCKFARSNDCLSHVVTKDLTHLLPDGEIHMAFRTILFDLSGINPHSPAYVDMKPGAASAARAVRKVSKYHAHAERQGCTFVPFVVDSYGCLGPDALQFIKDIRDESLFSLSAAPSPFRLSRSAFLAQLSATWQADNAKIVVKWLTMIRDQHIRVVVRPADKPMVALTGTLNSPAVSLPPSLHDFALAGLLFFRRVLAFEVAFAFTFY